MGSAIISQKPERVFCQTGLPLGQMATPGNDGR